MQKTGVDVFINSIILIKKKKKWFKRHANLPSLFKERPRKALKALMLLRFHVGAQTGRSQTWRRKRKSLGLCENKPAQLEQMSWARVLYEQMVEGNTAREHSWKDCRSLCLHVPYRSSDGGCREDTHKMGVLGSCILKVSFKTLQQFKTSNKAKGIYYQCGSTDMISDLPACPQVVGLWQLNLISD